MSEILLSRQEIGQLVHRLGRQVNERFAQVTEDPVLVVGVLTGAFLFLADLVRTFEFPNQIDFIRVSSYGTSHESSRRIQMLGEPTVSPRGRHVLLVEDIIDTGYTFDFLLRYFESQGACDIASIALLDKTPRREIPVHCDFIGTTIPDRFVAGYGLDGGGLLRGLPDIIAVD